MIHNLLTDLSDLFMGLLAVILGLLILWVAITIAIRFNRFLLVPFAVLAFACSAVAVIPPVPSDETSPIGTWGYETTLEGETKLLRESVWYTNLLLALILGSLWSKTFTRNVHPL